MLGREPTDLPDSNSSQHTWWLTSLVSAHFPEAVFVVSL